MPLAPEYQAMFEQLAAAGPTPSLSEIPVSDARDAYRAMRPVNPELAIHATEDRQVSGPLGDIPIRIYRPEGDGPFGTLVYFHGGGWVIGDIDTCDAVCRELATLANIVVVSVDYRMAPEHVFPAAVDDCYAVVEWVSNNQGAVNGNGRIGVAGESAGGNLAVETAHDAGERNAFCLVGDQQRTAGQLVFLLIERGEFFAFGGVAYDDNRLGRAVRLGEQMVVKGVQRLAGLEHHVVGDVDNVVDAANADPLECVA